MHEIRLYSNDCQPSELTGKKGKPPENVDDLNGLFCGITRKLFDTFRPGEQAGVRLGTPGTLGKEVPELPGHLNYSNWSGDTVTVKSASPDNRPYR